MTIVAAWMSAETGVGPSIASGSHEWSGSCADLPVAPTKNATQMRPSTPWAGGSLATRSKTSTKFIEPKTRNVVIIPMVKPQSPMRFITKAFFAAPAGSGRSNQKPMRR